LHPKYIGEKEISQYLSHLVTDIQYLHIRDNSIISSMFYPFIIRLFTTKSIIVGTTEIGYNRLPDESKGVQMSNMVSNPEEYFRKLIHPSDDLLTALEAEAQREGIPIIGPVVGELLYLLVRLTQATSILELGTATGYSAIFLARGCEASHGRVVTLENNEDIAFRAQENFQKAGLEDRIEIRVGDALEEIRIMKTSFDFILMDIEKKDYQQALPDCHRLLKVGGLLVADNVGFKDADGFNRTIFSHPGWRSVNLFSFLPFHSPEHDGLCLALRL
jgi:predicted O-methyltransferase YrrM